MIRMIIGFALIVIGFDPPEFLTSPLVELLGQSATNAVALFVGGAHIFAGIVIFGVGYLSTMRGPSL